jgi:Pyruvate/2-oxoacid:ferredoxin oxidoreductase delta subunit
MLAQMGRKNVIADVRRVIKASGFTWPVKLVSALWVIFKAQGIKEVGRIVASFIATAVKNAREYGVMSFFQFLSMKLYMFPQLPLIINVQHYHLESGPEILEGSKLYKEFFLGDEYSRFYQTSVKGTPMTRTIPIAKALAPEEKILNTEEAHKIIDAASLIALTPCACRARTEKMGIRKCKDQNPVGTCIMLGMAAMTMDGWGWGVKVTKQKAKDYLDDMIDKGLVPITINMEDTTNCLICLCCDCCCSQTEGRVSKKNPTAIAPSNFYPQTNRKLCSYCGTCEERCIFDAIKVDKEKQTWRLNPALCVGCGVCVVGCKEEAVKLYRKERHTPFKTTYELYDQIEKDNSMN